MGALLSYDASEFTISDILEMVPDEAPAAGVRKLGLAFVRILVCFQVREHGLMDALSTLDDSSLRPMWGPGIMSVKSRAPTLR